MDERIKRLLKDIVGEKGFSDSLMDLVSYSYDFSGHRSRPEGAVWPETTEQVSEILRLTNLEGIPVVPRGAGTGATGMAIPTAGGLVMDLLRINRIIEICIPDRVAVVQPGVVHADLQAALAPHGFFFPPDPASGSAATLGGNVATNAGGLKGGKYGTTRDYVMALEVVLPDGRVLRTGSRCMKSVSGYDMTRLLVGSEGTLGVITEITLKINPRPAAVATSLACFPTLVEAGEAVSRIMRSGIIPSVCELLDRHIIALLIQEAGLDLPRADALLLVETDGFTSEEAGYQMEKVIEVFRSINATEIRRAVNSEDAVTLWKGRKAMGSLIAGIRPDFHVEDITVPMSRIAELLEGIGRIEEEHGLRIPTAGHAGDGNLHPHFLFDAADKEEAAEVEKAKAELFHLALSLGGTLSGEHGIGITKADFMGHEHGPVAMEMMAGIKRLFDPRNLLNPGKMGLAVR
jgi:glycolate oxidase